MPESVWAAVYDREFIAFYRLLNGSEPCQLDPELWFPDIGERNARAKGMCLGCHALPACQTYALRHPEVKGIWGATSDRDRRKARKASA